MSAAQNSPRHLVPPMGGVIIGRVVKALRLDDASVGGDAAAAVFVTKAVQRCFSGERPTDKTRSAICEAVVRALLHAKLLPSDAQLLPNEEPGKGEPPDTMYIAALTHLVGFWDAFAGALCTQSAPITRPDLATMAVLRLVAIDLACRWAGLAWLAGARSLQERVPEWATAHGCGAFMQHLLDDARVTPAMLTRGTRAPKTDVFDWLKGKCAPSELHVPALARYLGPLLGTTGPALARRLRCVFAMCQLGDELADIVGRQRVESLGRAVTRYASYVLLRYGHGTSDAQLRLVALSAVLFGSDLPTNRHLLEELVERETKPLWKTELRCASAGHAQWFDRVQHCLQHIGGLDDAAATAAAETGTPFEEMRRRMAASAELALIDTEDLPGELRDEIERESATDIKFAARQWETLASEASAQDDLQTAIARWREAVKLDPTNADYHFFLGAELGQLGITEEALSECWVATQLRPEWDRPRVEVGIILFNAGRYEEAAKQLEDAERALSSFPPNLGYVLGRARMALGDAAGALVAFERTLALEPDHALALDASAQCAFALGEVTKGQNYAKEANHLGQVTTYEAWKRGAFRKKK